MTGLGPWISGTNCATTTAHDQRVFIRFAAAQAATRPRAHSSKIRVTKTGITSRDKFTYLLFLKNLLR